MSNVLGSLRETLMSGTRLSKQGSYSRRAPERESLPYFVRARDGLKEFLRDNPDSVEAWLLLSQAEESLLNYGEAIAGVENALALSEKHDKRLLKKLAMLRESFDMWSKFPLSPDQLRDLGDFLAQHGASDEKTGRTLQFTKMWLTEKGFTNEEDIVEKLKYRGGYTDFTILCNLVRG